MAGGEGAVRLSCDWMEEDENGAPLLASQKTTTTTSLPMCRLRSICSPKHVR
jgi:hypothetical protein